jgi:predicted acylesterase/phospholipase RssA/CRP-like cAMP-binding protein
VAAYVQVLRRSALCAGLSQGEIRYIAERLQPRMVPAGCEIVRQGEPGQSMYFVDRGRVRVSISHGGEPPRTVEYLGRGGHFGEMALLTDGTRAATVTAVIDTWLLELAQAEFQKLLIHVPGFAANLSRAVVARLRRDTARRERPHRPAVVALVSGSPACRSVVRPLAARLLQRGETLGLLTDSQHQPPGEPHLVVERLPASLVPDALVAAVKTRIHQLMEHQSRVLLDVAEQAPSVLAPLLSACEEVLWLVDTRQWEASLRLAAHLAAHVPGLGQRLRLVWLLAEHERFAPADVPQGLAVPSFKIPWAEHAQPAAVPQRGVERLARHLRGTRVGVALGGGGARGLAHLGVLGALEDEGVTFDLVAGTSSGALMGLSYAGGWSPWDALPRFRKALTPPRWVRSLPGGYRWYMIGMFRLDRWDRLLRPFLHKATLQQLMLPLYTVAVDLVSGREVVSDSGDAIRAVMESINIPLVSRPILRDGMALVDGGLLNNLPADVARARGASFVVGVDVVAELPRRFGKNQPDTPTERMQPASLMETVLRVTDVQAYGLTSLRTDAVDLMIRPDTTQFEFADFTRADELAEVGRAAALEVLPTLKQALEDLERE